MPPHLSDRTTAQLTAADQHYQSGELAEAETLYRQVWEEHPDSLTALTWLALIANLTGKPEESIAYYDRLLALEPSGVDLNQSAILLDINIELYYLGGRLAGTLPSISAGAKLDRSSVCHRKWSENRLPSLCAASNGFSSGC